MKRPEAENVTKTASWMPCPKIETEFPGLSYICPLSELIVVRERDALHDVIGTSNIGYTVFNNQGEKLFLAVQEKRYKKFDLKIFNHYGNEVIRVKRPYTFCLDTVLVWSPPGNFVGSVNEVISCVNSFNVKNRHGEVVLKIKAQGLFNFVYKILSHNEEIGKVANDWKPVEVLNVKNFGVSFPASMEVGDKAVLLGACFLIGCLKY